MLNSEKKPLESTISPVNLMISPTSLKRPGPCFFFSILRRWKHQQVTWRCYGDAMGKKSTKWWGVAIQNHQ